MKAEIIDSLIAKENDAEKRNVLLILQCLTANLTTTTSVLTNLETKLHRKFVSQQETLEGHSRKIQTHTETVIKINATWKIISFIFGLLQTSVVIIGSYAYETVADLRDTVVSQGSALAVLQENINVSGAKLSSLLRLTELDSIKDISSEEQVDFFKKMLGIAEMIEKKENDQTNNKRHMRNLENQLKTLQAKKVITHSK